MKQQLHRSVTFWSGLLVMGFVCWAWWESFTTLSYIDRGGKWQAASNRGGVVLSHRTYPLGPIDAGRVAHDVPHPNYAAFPEPFLVRGMNEEWPRLDRWEAQLDEASDLRHFYQLLINSTSPANWTLVVPHWLILLTVAAVWLGLLFWRARRRRKAVAL